MPAIDRRQFLTQSVAGSALAQNQSAAGRPNILHIMSDQQQWGCIADRLPARTPNLNRLVKEGTLFERSYTPSAVCCPARAMILSGAYHWHNGVFNQIHSSPSVHRDMYPDVVLYAHRLKEAGYRLGYTGKWHASWVRCPADFGYEMAAVQGCDPVILRKYDMNPDRVETPNAPIGRHPLKMVQWPGDPQPVAEWGYVEGPEEGVHEWQVAESAIRMMRRFARDGKPWMLETHFVDPHDPYFPRKPYLDHYDPRSIPVPKSFRDTFEGKPGMHRREAATWGHMTDDDYRQSRACYYALVEQLDRQIGRLLDALEETGQARNTIVVFTTDHGDMCGNHGMWIKGWIPYEETYRIPLVVRWPGVAQAGVRCDRLVQTHDLAHTYTAAAGAKPLPYADGRSLQPLLANPRADWPNQIMCAYYGGEFLYTQRIAITDRFKYVFNGFDIDEMYDLDRDPEEMHNAAYDPAYAKYTDDMRARLYEMMAQFEDPYGLPERWTLPGGRPNRYGAPRYLPRGKRL